MPQIYPIYDSIVEQMILEYYKSDQFTQFYRYELREDYVRYTEIIDLFRKFYGLDQFTFKEIDKFLWSYGREILGITSG